MDTAAAARAWVEAWERAWPTGNVEALECVYDEAAVFYSHPFREQQAPRDYATWAFAEQASAVCRFGARNQPTAFEISSFSSAAQVGQVLLDPRHRPLL